MVWRLGLVGGGQCFLSGGRARHRVIFWRKEIVILKKYLGNYCLQLLSTAAAAAMCANPSLSSTNYSCLRSIVYLLHVLRSKSKFKFRNIARLLQ